jgi:hypothetical protein
MDLMRRIGVGTVLVVRFLLPHGEALAQDLTEAWTETGGPE